MTAPGNAAARFRLGLLVLGAALAASAWALDWNLEAVGSLAGLRAAAARFAEHLAGYAAPDLSPAVLAKVGALGLETLAVALLGTTLGLCLGFPLAMASATCLAPDSPGGPGPFARARIAFARLLLDVLRGVPDFLWAILLANLTGMNATTGALAIGVATAGVFGKVLGEQWDNLDPARYRALATTGASPLQVFAYGILPLGARAAQSFVLMRTECAVRNASVIGVVGGGGLGASLWDEYSDGNWARMATVLLGLVALTVATDLGANLLRRQLRVDPNHPRAPQRTDRAAGTQRRLGAAVATAALLAGAVVTLWPALVSAADELHRIDGAFVREFATGLLVPSFEPAVLYGVLRHAATPLAIAALATAGSAVGAALLAYPASVAFQLDAHRFCGERLGPAARALRAGLVASARALALVLRSVPEVAWVLLLSVFFRQGVTPCVLAVAMHGTGVLQRVFTETVDNLPYQPLERTGAPSRAASFLFSALPRALPDWRTYTLFQFEVDLRIGVALGIVGAGGLGDRFDSNLKFREFGAASSYLLGMVLLTTLVDRLARRLQPRRACS